MGEADGRPRMVAIDDEVEFTTTLQQFFGARGYEVRIALTGPSGLALVESHTPDVVLVDLKLPGMDGDQLLQRIRRDHPAIRVIIITAYNDGGKTRDRLLRAGAFAHFDKPITSLRELAETVKRAVAVQQPLTEHTTEPQEGHSTTEGGLAR